MEKKITITDKDVEQAKAGLKALHFAGAIYYATLQLIEELVKENSYNKKIKRDVSMFVKAGEKVNEYTSNEVLAEKGDLPDYADPYCENSYEVFEALQEKSGYFGSNKYYQIICALSTIGEEYDNTSGVYQKLHGLHRVWNASRKLKSLGYTPCELTLSIARNFDKTIQVN